MWASLALGRPSVLKGRRLPALFLRCPPLKVRRAAERTESEPYTTEPSIQAVMELVCWRGLSTEVAVVESYCERLSGMICVPVLKGSNEGSPVGTEMLNGSAGEALWVRSRSWSR